MTSSVQPNGIAPAGNSFVHSRWRRGFLLLLPTLLLSAAVATATTFTVTNTADSGAGSFRQAIADAQEDDTINFAPDVRGTIALMNGELVISKALTILGPGAPLLTIEGESMLPGSRVLRIDAHGKAVSISGLTFTRGLLIMFGPEGGGIRNDSNLTLTACTVSSCTAAGDVDSDAKGGGIYNATGSSIQLLDCTLQDNGASGGAGFHGGPGGSAYGGALWNSESATASLQNCTISGNAATGASGSCLLFCAPDGNGNGAGIYNAGDLVMTACTVGSNTATAPVSSLSGGGGIWNIANAQITNSIVAENTGGDSPDAGGIFASDGFNLIGSSDGSDGFTALGDQTGTIDAPLDPMLGPLQDNGGPTWTMALLPGSPAIDAGTSANLLSDQRGGTRTHDDPDIPNAPGSDGTDIGSFELGGLIVTLGNISTRLPVGTADDAMIGGFIITGTQPKKVIVRAIGPSLALVGKLEDPILELHGPDGALIASNDNWRDTQEAEILATTIPPTDDAEAAIVQTLAPAAYTAIVRGKNGTTGVALVEVYALETTAGFTAQVR